MVFDKPDMSTGKLWTLTTSFLLPSAVRTIPTIYKSFPGPVTARKQTNPTFARITKSKRLKAKHLGARSSAYRPIPGSKSSPLKKKMDGSVTRRQ